MKNILTVSLAIMLVLSLAVTSQALEVGEIAPDFTLNDTDGNSYTLSDYRGQVVFLNFMGCT